MVGDTYRVTFENHCFCPVEVLRPVRLTVRDGAISEVTRLMEQVCHAQNGERIAPSTTSSRRSRQG